MNVNVNIQSAGGRTATVTPISVIGETEWGEFGVPKVVNSKSQFYAAFGAANNTFTEGCMFLLDKGVSLKVTRVGVANQAGTGYVGTKGTYGVAQVLQTPTFTNVFRDGIYRAPITSYFLHDGSINQRQYPITAVTAPVAPATYTLSSLFASVIQSTTDYVRMVLTIDGDVTPHFNYIRTATPYGIGDYSRPLYAFTANTSAGSNQTLFGNLSSESYDAATNETTVVIITYDNLGTHSTAQFNALKTALGINSSLGAVTYSTSQTITPSFPVSANGEIVVDGDITGVHNINNNQTVLIVNTAGSVVYNVASYAYDSINDVTVIETDPSVLSFGANVVVVGATVVLDDLVTPESITVAGTAIQSYLGSATTSQFTIDGTNAGNIYTFGNISTVGSDTLIEFSGGTIFASVNEQLELRLGNFTVVEVAGDFTLELPAGTLSQLTSANVNQTVTVNNITYDTTLTNSFIEFSSILISAPLNGTLSYTPANAQPLFQLEAKYAGAYSQNLEVQVTASVSGVPAERDYKTFINGVLMQEVQRLPLTILAADVAKWNDVFEHFSIVGNGSNDVTIDSGSYQLSAGSAPAINNSHVFAQITTSSPFGEDDRAIIYLTDNPDVAITKELGEIAKSLNIVAYAPLPLNLNAANEVTHKLTNNYDNPYLRLVGNTITYLSKNTYSQVTQFVYSGVLLAAISAFKREALPLDGGRYWEALGTVANSLNISSDVVRVLNSYTTRELESLRANGVSTVVQKRGDIYVENHVNSSIDPSISNELGMGVVRWVTRKMEDYAYAVQQRQLILNPETWKMIFTEFRSYVEQLVADGVINPDVTIYDDIEAGSIDDLVYNSPQDVLAGNLKMGLEFTAFGILRSINITFVVI